MPDPPRSSCHTDPKLAACQAQSRRQLPTAWSDLGHDAPPAADRLSSWPPPRLHGDVSVDDLTFRQPDAKRNISRRAEYWIGLLHNLFKLSDCTLNALLHETCLCLQIHRLAWRAPHHCCHHSGRANEGGATSEALEALCHAFNEPDAPCPAILRVGGIDLRIAPQTGVKSSQPISGTSCGPARTPQGRRHG